MAIPPGAVDALTASPRAVELTDFSFPLAPAQDPNNPLWWLTGLFGANASPPGPKALIKPFAPTTPDPLDSPCGLICNGAAGTAAHPNGQAGGILFGDGGAGWDSTDAGVNGGDGGAAGLLFGSGGRGGNGADGTDVLAGSNGGKGGNMGLLGLFGTGGKGGNGGAGGFGATGVTGGAGGDGVAGTDGATGTAG
ncbi:PGRS repeat-containing protein, partial [Mycolicibacterium mucogenicum]|uniref:PGRS repeat-containing protein n=3 Tax=Mycobacteriaceae TaxID=1762 RepID=UPI0039082D07